LYYLRLPQVRSLDAAQEPTPGHFATKRDNDETNWTRSWVFTPYLHAMNKYENQINNKELRKRIMRCQKYCHTDCNSNCAPKYRVLFGNEIHMCRGESYGGYATWFVNPDEAEIEWIKMLLELEKTARRNS